MFFEEFKVKRSEVFLVLWDTINALVQLAAVCDFYSQLQYPFCQHPTVYDTVEGT